MEQRTDAAYRLTWETNHLEFCDEEYDLELEEFLGWESTNGLYEITPYELPDPVIFYAHPLALTSVDYLTSNVYWPVMSRRMYYALLTVGNFPHRAIPIAMMDSTQSPFAQEQRLASGKPNPEITNFNDFVAVQLLEYSNFFDFERSSYTRNSRRSDWIDTIDAYVMNEPPEGFPPLFRLAADPVVLFISAKARETLRESDVRGTAYYPLDRLQIEVDIPVQLATYS
jgi:hypothetical protein